MRKAKDNTALLIVLASIISLGGVGDSLAQDEDDLQKAIEAKQAEVEQLNKEIGQTQSKITNLQGQGRTLGQAIETIDTGIKQADLGIRSSEVGIEKLSLEIQSLSSEVEEVGEEVYSKQEIVGELLRRLQRNDEKTILESLMMSGTLADGVSEINALKALQDNLNAEVGQLVVLQGQLEETIDVSDSKKSQLEVEVVNLENRRIILDEQKSQKQVLLVRTKNEEAEYQRLLTDLEKEQQALLNEIADIEAQLSKGFDRSTVPSRQKGFFAWPVTSGGVPSGVLTQHYGEVSYLYRGRPHNGTDIGAPTGTEVRATASGVVAHVDYNGWYYQYGRYVLIDHQNGLSTLYAHLSQTTVSPGQKVERGDLIGYVGNTGYSTGPHLHLGLYATPSGGWSRGGTRETGGLISIPPASGLVPVGVTLNPEQYL